MFGWFKKKKVTLQALTICNIKAYNNLQDYVGSKIKIIVQSGIIEGIISNISKTSILVLSNVDGSRLVCMDKLTYPSMTFILKRVRSQFPIDLTNCNLKTQDEMEKICPFKD